MDEEKRLLQFICETPQLQSFLYDMDLLPEQLDKTSFNWKRMLMVAMLWETKIEPFAAAPADTEVRWFGTNIRRVINTFRRTRRHAKP